MPPTVRRAEWLAGVPPTRSRGGPIIGVIDADGRCGNQLQEEILPRSVVRVGEKARTFGEEGAVAMLAVQIMVRCSTGTKAPVSRTAEGYSTPRGTSCAAFRI